MTEITPRRASCSIRPRRRRASPARRLTLAARDRARGDVRACRATGSAPALSMLGISWGIVSVVMLLAYGNGFHGALTRGFRGRVRRRRRRSSGPGRRACRPAASAPASACASRSTTSTAVGELPLVQGRQPGVHARACRSAYGNKQSSYLVRGVAAAYGAMRTRDAAAGRPVPRRRGRAAAAARRVHRQRGAAQAVRQHAAGRPDDPHRRHGLRGDRRA